MNKGNYLYLGVSAAFLTLAVLQFQHEDMLPMSIYMYVAWSSLELSLLELLKATTKHLRAIQLTQIRMTQDELNKCNRHIKVFGKFAALDKVVENEIIIRDKLELEMEELKKRKRVDNLEKVVNACTIVQIIACFVSFARISMRTVPNTLATNKTIGVLGLLSFALLSFSYYLTHSAEDEMTEIREKNNISNDLSEYYTEVLEKAATTEEDTNGND